MKCHNMLFICLVVAICVSGCAPDSRELDQRSMIMGMAIDQGKERLYNVTIQLPILGHGGDGDAAPQGREFETFSVEANNLWEAITDLESHTPTVLFFGHLKVIAVSEEIAKENMAEILDLLDRNARMANQLYLVVIENIGAGEFIEQESPLVRLPALYLDRFFRAGQRIGRVDEILLFEFLRDSNMISKASSLPLATIKDEALVIDGAAIFQDYKLVNKLKGTKSALNQLLRENRVDGMNYVTVMEYNGKKITTSFARLELRQDVQYKETDPVTFQLEIDGKGVVEEIANIELSDTSQFLKKLEEHLEKELRREVLQVINEMKEKNVEPWLFGHRIWAMNPSYFETLQWKERGWKEAKFEVKVKFDIKSTGQRGYHHKKKIGR